MTIGVGSRMTDSSASARGAVGEDLPRRRAILLIVFLGIELVSGRRVNQRAETVVHMVGFLLLLLYFAATGGYKQVHLDEEPPLGEY